MPSATPPLTDLSLGLIFGGGALSIILLRKSSTLLDGRVACFSSASVEVPGVTTVDDDDGIAEGLVPGLIFFRDARTAFRARSS